MSVNRTYTTEIPARCTTGLRSSGSLKTALLAIASTTMLWQRRARSRIHLRDLEAHLLDDIGISPERRDREVHKPFWVR